MKEGGWPWGTGITDLRVNVADVDIKTAILSKVLVYVIVCDKASSMSVFSHAV